MSRKLPPLITRSLLKANGQYALIGLVVGLVLSMLYTVFTGQLIPLKNLLFYGVFSIIITVCIANCLYVFEHYIRPKAIKPWQIIATYYFCNLLGMFVGTELSYFILCSALGTPFRPLTHYDDYKVSPIIVIIVGSLIYLYQTQRSAMQFRLQEKELDVIRLKELKTNAELKSLQSRINPHFLYNALNTIAGFTMTDAEKAEEMTIQLSRLFRYSLGSQHSNLISIGEEIEIVNTYLAIEKVRFGSRIQFEVSIDPDCKKLLIPRFLLQPIVENALKHGLKNVLKDGLLCISIRLIESRIRITMADNGSPFPDSLQLGYGLQSTYDKLDLIYGQDYRLQFANAPHKHIQITLPLTEPAVQKNTTKEQITFL